jgi:hypothetical protein
MNRTIVIGGLVVGGGLLLWHLLKRKEQKDIEAFNRSCIEMGKEVLKSGEVCGDRK